MALLTFLTPSSSAARPAVLKVPGEVGTIDTLAGPGHCPTRSTIDPSSGKVGALAVDPASGVLWFESDGAGGGRVTKVKGNAPVAVHDVITDPPKRRNKDSGLPLPGRLAAVDNRLFIALKTGIAEFGGSKAVTGTLDARGQGRAVAAGDGGAIQDARFAGIVAFVADEAGNFYVADKADAEKPAIAVRFVNRSDQPRTFYRGTPEERVVAAGSIDTIAGGASTSAKPAAGLLARAVALAVSGERLYVATSGGTGPAQVHLVNLGEAVLGAHGKSLAPAGVAKAVASVPAPRPNTTASPVPVLSDLAADADGNLYLAEAAHHRVRRVDASGVATLYAGTGRAGFNGNDRRATRARLDRPYDIALGDDGRLYVSDAGNDQVRVVESGGTIRATFGNGATHRRLCGPRSSSAPPPAGAAGHLTAIAAGDGSAYFSGSGLGQVKALAADGSIRTVAGRAPDACPEGTTCPSKEEDPPAKVDLSTVSALAHRPGGGLYVLDEFRVRLLNLTDKAIRAHGVTVPAGAIRTVAGHAPDSEPEEVTDGDDESLVSGLQPGQKALGTRISPSRATIKGAVVWYGTVAADTEGNLFISHVPSTSCVDPASNRCRAVPDSTVRQVDPAGTITDLTEPYKGSGTLAEAQARAARGEPFEIEVEKACCAYPVDIAVDEPANLYIADRIASRVWYLNRGDAPVEVHGVTVPPGATAPVAGAGVKGLNISLGREGNSIPALEASLSPTSVAVDGHGNLFVIDSEQRIRPGEPDTAGAGSVRRVDGRGVITTVAGNGQHGYNGDGVKANTASLDNPWDLSIDACGNLLIADFGNDRIRRLNLVPSCAAATQTTPASSLRRSGGVPLLAGLAAAGVVVLGTAVLVRRRRRRAPSPSPVPGT